MIGLIIAVLFVIFGIATTVIGETRPLAITYDKKGKRKHRLTLYGKIYWALVVVISGYSVYGAFDNYIQSGRIDRRIASVENRDTIPQRHLNDADKDSLKKIEPYKQFDVYILTATNTDEQIVFAKEIQKYLQEIGFRNPNLAGQTGMTDVFRIRVYGLRKETNPTNYFTEVDIGSLH